MHNNKSTSNKFRAFSFLLTLTLINISSSQSWGSIKVNGSQVVKKNGEIDTDLLAGTNASLAKGDSIFSNSESKGTGIQGLGDINIQNMSRKKKLRAVKKGRIQTININEDHQLIGNADGGLISDGMDLLKTIGKEKKKIKKKKSRAEKLKEKLKKKYQLHKKSLHKEKKQIIKEREENKKTVKKQKQKLEKRKKEKTDFKLNESIYENLNKNKYHKRKKSFNFDTISGGSRLKKNLVKFIKKNKLQKKSKKKGVFDIKVLNSKKMNVRGISYRPLDNSDAFGPRKPKKKIKNQPKNSKQNVKKGIKSHRPLFTKNKKKKKGLVIKNHPFKKEPKLSKKLLRQIKMKQKEIKQKKMDQIKKLSEESIKTNKIKLRLVDFKKKEAHKVKAKRKHINKETTKIKSPSFVNSMLSKDLKKLKVKSKDETIIKKPKYDFILVTPAHSNSKSYSIADLLNHVKLRKYKPKKSKIANKAPQKIRRNKKYQIDKNFLKNYLQKNKPFNLIKIRKSLQTSKVKIKKDVHRVPIRGTPKNKFTKQSDTEKPKIKKVFLSNYKNSLRFPK